MTPSTNNTVWTITLRPGVQFQDGTPLDAAAVKLNLDSYRGAPGAPNASPDLFKIYLGFISDVSVVDPMTVKVTLNTPVPQFPAYLYSTGRMGMMAPAQLNAGDACATKMIGTGPFKLQTYLQNEKTVVVKNPNYWQKGYPKADSITFVPVTDGATRNNQLQGGQLDIMHQSNPIEVDNLRSLGSQVKLLTQKPGEREIAQYWLISKNAPFNSQAARTAFAPAVNRKPRSSPIRAKNVFQLANAAQRRRHARLPEERRLPGLQPQEGPGPGPAGEGPKRRPVQHHPRHDHRPGQPAPRRSCSRSSSARPGSTPTSSSSTRRR